MFSEPSGKHNVPYFHAYSGEHLAVFSVSPLEMLAGALPLRQRRLVEAWAESHREELLLDWNLLQQGRKPHPIPPLS
jgi:hypothetical protein